MNHNPTMLSRSAAFMIWALVAATTVFWALRLAAQGRSVPQATIAVPQSMPTRTELSRVLGSTPVVAAAVSAAPELSARFVLSGVMSPPAHPSSGQAGRGAGLALIAVDGQPPKPYALGAKVDNDLVLLAVTHRTASIGPAGGAPLVTLELPELPPPATGTLPTLPMGADSPSVAAPQVPQAPEVPPVDQAVTRSARPVQSR